MRRLLICVLSLLVSFVVAAQQYTSLEIDASSLAPVHSDALTGVAIDKIMPDYSKRPCARIKMHINRMTREDIDKLSVTVVGGNVVVMRRVVAAEGNGLIIELTAKEQTRFYLHHDKYGDSNEVTLNLEGNKEYRLNAELRLMQSIVITTNVVGADIYVDDLFRGKSGENYTLTVKDLRLGNHKIRVVYGTAKAEKEVFVSDANIHFKVDVNTALLRPQYIVFQVSPANAAIVVGGKNYTLDADGVATMVLNNGAYTYSVSAKDYHTETGQFVVSGAKVSKSVALRPAHGWLKIGDTEILRGASVYVDGELIGTAPVKSDRLPSGAHSMRIVKNLYKTFDGKVTISDNETLEYAPSLVADFANVTLNVGGDSDIFVNGKKVGNGSWSGDLATGAYIFEARKERHRTTSITKNIVANPPKQSYTIPTPTPIMGTLNIMSSPAIADVYIDGKVVGQTPLMVDLIIGKHEIYLKKDNLGTKKQSVDIAEKQTLNLNLTLTKLVPDNAILYTSSNGEVVTPNRTDRFGANIVSNTYEDGQGVILFDKPVTSIGDWAFYYCSSLTSVTIGNSVTSIGEDAFRYCSSLTSVYCKATTPPTGGYDMFDNNASGRRIYVPRASVSAYKAAEYWRTYADYIVGYDF